VSRSNSPLPVRQSNAVFVMNALLIRNRFERHQYIEVREGMGKATGDFAGKGAGDIYGAEHLCRLLGKLLFLTIRCNTDPQSLPSGVDCSDQHGSPVGQPSSRGTLKVDQLARTKCYYILRQRVRDSQSRVCRKGSCRLGGFLGCMVWRMAST